MALLCNSKGPRMQDVWENMHLSHKIALTQITYHKKVCSNKTKNEKFPWPNIVIAVNVWLNWDNCVHTEVMIRWPTMSTPHSRKNWDRRIMYKKRVMVQLNYREALSKLSRWTGRWFCVPLCLARERFNSGGLPKAFSNQPDTKKRTLTQSSDRITA